MSSHDYTSTLKRFAGLSAGIAGALLLGAQAVSAIEPGDVCPGPQPTSCVQLDMGGSSAGTLYATTVPLLILDSAPTPIHYVNGVIGSITSDKLHVWTGNRAGVPTIIRYAATGSSDGIVKPTNYTTQTMTFLDHVPSTGCAAGVPASKTINSITYNYTDVTGCTGGTVARPVELGASDVHGSSFHQVGGGSVKPLDQSALTSIQAAIVPFKFVLGKSVKRDTGAWLVDVGTLSRLEVEGLLSGNVKDWSQIGLVGDLDGDGIADATAPVYRCLRAAGSGTKAALDETVMKDAGETISGTTDLTDPTPVNNTYFGKSTQDVRDCVAGKDSNGNGVPEFPNDNDPTTGDRPGHPLAIGYLDADAFIPDSPAPFGDADTLAEGYDVKLNGYHANDPALGVGNEANNIRCGKYYYWVGWRLNYPTVAPPGVTADMVALRDAFVASASGTSVNNFWVLPADMYVFKNADAGPISWKAGAHPLCGS